MYVATCREVVCSVTEPQMYSIWCSLCNRPAPYSCPLWSDCSDFTCCWRPSWSSWVHTYKKKCVRVCLSVCVCVGVCVCVCLCVSLSKVSVTFTIKSWNPFWAVDNRRRMSIFTINAHQEEFHLWQKASLVQLIWITQCNKVFTNICNIDLIWWLWSI